MRATTASVNQLAKVEYLAADNVHLLAQQLGYDGACTVGALEDGIRFYQQRTAEACLELGKRLLLLKEASLHGEFMPRLELLGVDHTAAKRFMSVAAKFSKGAPAHLLQAANNQRKLVELLVLDDSEIAELDEGATVRGISLDDVDRMSARELRAALRESKEEAVAQEALVTKLHANNDKLQRRIAKAKPEELIAQDVKEATERFHEAIGFVRGGLRLGFEALAQHESGGNNSHRGLMGGCLKDLRHELDILEADFFLADLT